MPCTPKRRPKCPRPCPPKRPKRCPSKCMRKGPITKNGYLNFMRDYRKRVCGLSPTETMRRGARAWHRLSCVKKEEYRTMRCRQPCPRPRPRRKRCPPARKRSRSKPKRPPMCETGSGAAYLNFLRSYRSKHSEISPSEAVIEGAEHWCHMSQCERNRFK